MPVRKCAPNKWKIGTGQCMYTSHGSAMRAYVAYLAKEGEPKPKKKSKKKEKDEKDNLQADITGANRKQVPEEQAEQAYKTGMGWQYSKKKKRNKKGQKIITHTDVNQEKENENG